MMQTCPFCHKEYEAGEPPFLLPVCTECAEKYDEEIIKKTEIVKIAEESKENKWHDMGITPRHYQCDFNNFIAHDKEEQLALESCKRMSMSKKGIVAIIGNNGTGKSHLMSATVKEIGKGHIFKMIEFGMFIRRAFEQGNRTSEEAQLEKLINYSFLGIDEIEKSKFTSNEMNWLSYVIDERNENFRATMISGNCHPKRIHADGTQCDKCFESFISPDILDRISQYGVICYFSGKSNRAELRGK